MKPIYYVCKRFFPDKQYHDFNVFGKFKEIVTRDYLLCVRNRTNPHSSYEMCLSSNIEDIKKFNFWKNEQVIKCLDISKGEGSLDSESSFEFCGYDIVDEQDDISLITNCGIKVDFPTTDLFTDFGLINTFENAKSFLDKYCIADKMSKQEHFIIYAIWRSLKLN